MSHDHAPIWTWHSTWNLDAAPSALEGVAGILHGVGSAGTTAQEALNLAAFLVFAGGAWEGETAEAYQQHRERLSRDLAEFAEIAGPAARALYETAEVLRCGQDKLLTERHRIASVPAFEILNAVVFLPRDDLEVGRVQDAVVAAAEIRSWVDAEISHRIGAFDAAAMAFQALADTWQPRTIRHLNLNAGMGNRDDSTTRADLDELAAAIAAGDADVVTLQEVLENNLEGEELEGEDGLLDRLRTETGQEWEVAAFAEAIEVDPEEWDEGNPGEQGYGNAILVRSGGSVQVPDGPEPTPVELGHPVDDLLAALGTREVPEDRVAAVAELTIREPDGS